MQPALAAASSLVSTEAVVNFFLDGCTAPLRRCGATNLRASCMTLLRRYKVYPCAVCISSTETPPSLLRAARRTAFCAGQNNSTEPVNSFREIRRLAAAVTRRSAPTIRGLWIGPRVGRWISATPAAQDSRDLLLSMDFLDEKSGSNSKFGTPVNNAGATQRGDDCWMSSLIGCT